MLSDVSKVCNVKLDEDKSDFGNKTKQVRLIKYTIEYTLRILTNRRPEVEDRSFDCCGFGVMKEIS